MKNMAKNFAKKKKGSIAIWQIFEIILFAALVYTFITLWPVFLQKQNVDYIAKTMVRAVETNGRIVHQLQIYNMSWKMISVLNLMM